MRAKMKVRVVTGRPLYHDRSLKVPVKMYGSLNAWSRLKADENRRCARAEQEYQWREEERLEKEAKWHALWEAVRVKREAEERKREAAKLAAAAKEKSEAESLSAIYDRLADPSWSGE